MKNKNTNTMGKLLRFSALILTILFAYQVKGQTGYRMGIQISPNIGFIPVTTDELSNPARLDLGFGLNVSRYFDERYSFNTGVEVPRIRATLRSLDGDTSLTFQASYIQIPLTFKMKTIDFGNWTIFARVGGSFGFKYRENVQFENIELNTINTDDEKYVDPLLLTVMASLGVEYDLGIESYLVLSLDFHRSLLNQLDNRKIEFLRREQPRLSWFAFNVGIIF